ncbi:hypothetical protein [Spirosoma jeollabukense]
MNLNRLLLIHAFVTMAAGVVLLVARRFTPATYRAVHLLWT